MQLQASTLLSIALCATASLAQIGSSLPALAPIAANTQSCHATDNVFFITENVQIGVPFNGGGGCSAIESKIQSEGVAVTGFDCQDDGNGDTQLQFNIPNLGSGVGLGNSVNLALDQTDPQIQGGFNCPSF